MPTRTDTRRDPQKGKKEFSTNKGFTVIELLIAVAVVAIVTSLALPSYRTIIEKRQVTSGAQQISAFLSLAQLEAVKRNEVVVVSYSGPDDGGNFCIGIDADDGACACGTDLDSCTIDGATRVMTQDNLNYPEALTAMTGDGAFSFDPVRGMLTNFTDVASVSFVSQPENTYALNVDVGPTGRVRICSVADSSEVPGFQQC